ncbi:uncharacterized protein PHACADRAFT_195008 [Phanerochaete carnosa HHB-10118-sp]|uniref:Protein kinase domain-containing protein n=1 Tax=Phanerochaete carnosa (strain HHB-10118-sp) TaxID=650164 RepID=K5W7N0_PHACS|nr:uncharacterized protein PHACADRAFT_195008 [Phanerochaete carnosa HHB-10118-sp]EKM54979.1 hypothetical protein PHACADRAFT_195008 [Phanerochaete carnosa HHB-10118-sp]
MAPEILDPARFDLQHMRHTPESDIHPFAMCVWTIFDGNAPFHDYPAIKATFAIIEGERPPQHTTMHPLPLPLWSLLNLCWKERPRDRLSSPDLYLRLRCMFQPVNRLRTSLPPTVRNLASVYTGVERLVPQIIYRPPKARQLAGTNASPIMFNVLGQRGCGINCLDALNERFSELQNSNDIIECYGCMALRIMPWSVSIHFHSGTTWADLAMRVSSYTQTFLDESLTKYLGPDTRWRLGPGAITLFDLELVGLQPVAVRDWQVHFRVRQVVPLAA